MTIANGMTRGSLFTFTCIFALSGFSGLIYESIWSHYLKLFLGHSSYAQVLVLTIFMGGMAIGAAVASRLSLNLTNLILAYGICEGIIGLFGIGFHGLFINVESYAFESLFPTLESSSSVHTAKWVIGALLILPQSILLGATFPLLATGLLRKFPKNSGKTLATLYFVNSMGAALGILANAFWLIPAVGLPGAIFTAGLINIAIALGIYYLSKSDRFPAKEPQQSLEKKTVRHMPLLLWVVALTGLASFMYEIAWIRMLTMVLGGSTHSFEIMLSAFIMGLALGSLFIRRFIDKIEKPVVTLGLIQVVMGLLAVLTIPFYNYTFNIMEFFLQALNRSESGYVLYGVSSLVISMLVMLPVTICAGTTLPLVTHILLKNGAQDKAIGKVYAFNTLGSIVGIALAAQIIMPKLGLQWVIVVGALVDVCLGLYLLGYHRDYLRTSRSGQAVLASLLAVLIALPFLGLDTQKMASGVFRYGVLSKDNNTETNLIFHEDGKTSTVVVKEIGKARIILNNGKPDAGVIMHSSETEDHIVKEETSSEEDELSLAAATPASEPASNTEVSGDQSTMVLLGTLPYLYKPEAKLIANIGLGSGVTTHTLLHKPEMERLDTIEIEQAVVNAASLFRPNVDNMFTDSRSKIHIEDAKTFFATSRQKYDVVVSEPPNPWVSGVAGLFTEEFYSDIQRYMTQDAVFVQWIHLYEISPELVGTVYAALRSRFPHIDLYRVSGSDIVFVASQSELSADFGVPFKYEGFSEQLAEVSILNEADLKFRRMAGTRKLDLFFAPFSNNANSDYYPILDIGAAKTRFMKANATGVLQLAESRSLNYISNEAQHDFEGITEDPLMSSIGEAINIQQFYKTLNEHDNGEKAEPLLTDGPDYSAANLHQALAICHTTETESEIDLLSERIVSIAQWAYPLSNTEQFKYLIARLDQCKSSLNKDAQQFIEINNAWTNNDLLLVKQLTDTWLEDKENIEGSVEHHLLQLGLTSRVALDNWEGFEGTYDDKRIELGNNLELNALWHLVVSLQDEN